MMNIPRPNATPDAPKAAKRSIFGLLFNPQLGPAFSPLRESTRIFLHLLAGVFSIYKLLPKDYPGLNDPEARLTLSDIIASAWQNVRFTREGLPSAIIFFAVVGVMAFSAFIAVTAILSLFVGKAHADSAFSPESKDIAQSWIDYLFNINSGVFPVVTDTYGDTVAALDDPFAGSVRLQGSLMTALAFYSDAILIVAAIILFYHLTAMVVETAHHGVAMGKRASQIWAPIRLVVAIGLLVPINGGLNSGQFIVIKMAELGSGLASRTWDVFLDQLASYKTKTVPPSGPIVQQVAADIIYMEACMRSWNKHVDDQIAAGVDLSGARIQPPTGVAMKVGSVDGIAYHYSSNSVADQDVCGWYFIPTPKQVGAYSTQLTAAAVTAQSSALQTALPKIQNAADTIQDIMNPSETTVTAAKTVKFDPLFMEAIKTYQIEVNKSMAKIADGQSGQMSDAVGTIRQYGWVMAGTFLNTISRIQGEVASAAVATTPVSHPPTKIGEEEHLSWKDSLRGIGDTTIYLHGGLRSQVQQDMVAFAGYQARVMESAKGSSPTADAQCAAMYGLSSQAGDGMLNMLFQKVDNLAIQHGVWAKGSGAGCGDGTNNKPITFGIQMNGTDPFAEMAALGHSNLQVTSDLIGWILGVAGVGAFASGFASSIPIVGGIGNLAGAAGSAAASVLGAIATIFFVAGFTLAFLVPLMPFMRFFFSVLSWVGALIEAIVAMPLVALAHLNPEGEGLPGQSARAAYFFVFNLFLRPILTIFGLICGLVVFMIAISFLNYGFAVAVAGAGGAAYGHEAMSRVLYSILYVAIVVTCANHCFMMIDHLPEHALKWMGGAAQAMPSMGDTSKFEQTAQFASGIAADKALPMLGSAAEHIGQGAGKGLSPQTPPAGGGGGATP